VLRTVSALHGWFRVKLEAEGTDDFEDGVKAGVAVSGECLVKAFPRKASITRHL